MQAALPLARRLSFLSGRGVATVACAKPEMLRNAAGWNPLLREEAVVRRVSRSQVDLRTLFALTTRLRTLQPAKQVVLPPNTRSLEHKCLTVNLTA